MSLPMSDPIQVHPDDALDDSLELKSQWHNAVFAASIARDEFAEAEALGSPTKIAAAKEALDAAVVAERAAFGAFRASL